MFGLDFGTALLSWREAVSRSHTSAQLAMALYVLESCVAWDKSIMKAVSTMHTERCCHPSVVSVSSSSSKTSSTPATHEHIYIIYRELMNTESCVEKSTSLSLALNTPTNKHLQTSLYLSLSLYMFYGFFLLSYSLLLHFICVCYSLLSSSSAIIHPLQNPLNHPAKKPQPTPQKNHNPPHQPQQKTQHNYTSMHAQLIGHTHSRLQYNFVCVFYVCTYLPNPDRTRHTTSYSTLISIHHRPIQFHPPFLPSHFPHPTLVRCLVRFD